ncbi:sensor domain-containing protein [Streptomyces sp. SR27]|uniref:sensor domain-containing protein n=1 Tax=Streptomyces sp. SR27 TaxID=3076630 RepID=UPI00295B0C54|nr:sensor domain-containing protein [Streptomyces sp. SR27]MDV9188268.1 sensor domain-containing protein [Streptomyces sp. SR27]
MRSAVVAGTAVSLALLVSGCGGEGKSDDGKGKDVPKASASATSAPAPAAKALSAAELDKLIVEKGDLKGYQVAKAHGDDVVPASEVTTDKAPCAPIAHAMSFISPGSPAASVQRKVLEEPKKDATASPEEALLVGLGVRVTAVTLGSYDGQGAQDAFASVKKAGGECAGGFTVIHGAERTKVTKVAPESVTAGEEAVAFTVTSELEGRPFASKLVVFRQGNTLASFSTISFASGGVKALPKDVVDAQAAKLG